MIPHRGWAEDAAAFAILWLVLACVTGVILGAFIHHGTREMPPPEDRP